MEFLIGIFVGGLLYYIFAERKNASGKLILDLTESAEQPVVIKFHESLNDIYMRKQIVLDVEVLEDNSLN